MNAIVVVDRNWAIGLDGGLLFTLPTDMKRFRELTLHGTVIMGRKTLESFPGGHLLPDRRNIVITRNVDLVPPEAEVVPDADAAVEAAAEEDPDSVWVIGGGSVYASLLSQCSRTYITKVDAVSEGEPDTYFPNLDRLSGWEVEEESEPITENGLTYRFVRYVNRKLLESESTGTDAGSEGTEA